MKTKKTLKYVSMVFGIIVTSILLLIFGVLTLEKFIEEGPKYLVEILKDITNWYDNPTGFVFTYFIGYAVIWWKPLWGSIIILFVSLLYVTIAGFDGPPFFAGPTFLVGLFYLIYLLILRKNNKIHNVN